MDALADGCLSLQSLLAVYTPPGVVITLEMVLGGGQAKRKHLLCKGVSSHVEEGISENRHHGQDHRYQCNAPDYAVALVVLRPESSPDLHWPE